MAEIKEILTRTIVTVVDTILDIYTYFEAEIEEFLGFFIRDTNSIINDTAFAEGELGYSIQGLPNASFRVNDSGEFIANDLDADPYSIDSNGELIYDDVLAAPAALAASNILHTSFTANWNIVVGATKYYLDVSEDSQFNTYVTGYRNLDVGNVLEYEVSGLSGGITYYYRIRACNEIGASISSNIISIETLFDVLDADGNVYTYVTIGTQQWLVENLKTTKYADGTPIPNLTLDADWIAEDGTPGHDGAYCWYDNDIAYNPDYGALYNWYAVDNAHGLAPTGWRVPSSFDWIILREYIGGEAVAGGKLKDIGIGHWNTPNTGATDDYGFAAFGAGGRDHGIGFFSGMHETAYFWGSNNGEVVLLQYNSETLADDDYFYQRGFSVRCMRDTP